MHKRDRAKKQEVAEKVREIKMRQQNWFKQRAASQKSESANEMKQTNSIQDSQQRQSTDKSKNGTITKHTSALSSSFSEQPSATAIIASKKSKAKFHNWLQARERNEDEVEGYTHQHPENEKLHSYDSRHYSDDLYRSNHYQDQPYRDHKGSSEVNVLRVPSSRSPQYATPDPDWGSDDETGEITAAQLMSPSDFDNVADNIIAKVKGSMGMTSQPEHKKYSSSNQQSYNSSYKRDTSSSKINKNGNAEMSSHICPGCHQLMVPPHHIPMLLIPCGHTLCGRCTGHDKFCSVCHCPVQSSTANIMLQHIITDYQSNSQRQANRRDDTSNRKLKYREEYQNLLTRREILQEECSEISGNIKKISSKLKSEQQQVDSIRQEERNVQRQIAALQEKLEGLVNHRHQYETSCKDFEKQSLSEQNRLSLVKETLNSLQNQLEKTKLLAEADD